MKSLNKYFLLYTINNKSFFETVCLMDKKTKKIYLGSPIGSDFISIRQYGSAIKTDNVIPINKHIFLKIKKESFIELRKTNYVDFFNKYSLEEWII